jgi:hypothetical protein
MLACCAVACSSLTPTSSAPIITRYEAAACIPFSANPKVSPHSREWDNVLTLRDGTKVIVRGAQMPGGRITVSYSATGGTLWQLIREITFTPVMFVWTLKMIFFT